nr:dTDP-4-dehydrorhamnose reductase [Paraburkholderia busanensis]
MGLREQPAILLTGVNGQVGFELARSLQGIGTIVAPRRGELDLNDADSIRAVVRSVKPALIVNAAAYTAVDQAETDRDAAFRSNAEAPAVLASEAKRLGAALVHYSTDYVFDGTRLGPYVETDVANPQNVYGQSKLEGERGIVNSGCDHLIFRTSWVYGARGKNFMLTMLRLGAERSRLSVVADQYGAPTWANTLAALTACVIAQARGGNEDNAREWWRARSGIYHLTAGGQTSWHGFADAIFELAGRDNRPELEPIAAASYAAAARRPQNSVLSNEKFVQAFGMRSPDWQDALKLCLQAC